MAMKSSSVCSRTRENNKNKAGPVIWDTLYEEKALVGALSVIVKTDGSFASLVATLSSLSSPGVRQQGQHCRDPPGPRQLAGLQHTPAVSV